MAVSNKREKIHARVAKAAWHNNEPVFNPMDYQLSLVRCLNFYNLEVDCKVKQAWTIQYWKDQGLNVRGLASLNDCHFIQTGALIRLKERGVVLDDEHESYLLDQYHDLMKLVALEAKQKKEPKEEKKVAPKPTVQDKMNAIVTQLANEIDGALDDLVSNGETSFDPAKFVKTQHISSPVAKKLLQYYTFAIQDVANPEGYMTGRLYTRLKKFYAELEQALSAMKVARIQAPRKRKQKPAGELVKNLKYLQSAEGLVSEIPAKIVGATEVFLFNTEKRKITHLVAAEGLTLSVKGTTILNIDPDKSITKTVRKPEILANVKTMTLRPMRALVKDLKAVARPANGRMNDKTIILKVF